MWHRWEVFSDGRGHERGRGCRQRSQNSSLDTRDKYISGFRFLYIFGRVSWPTVCHGNPKDDRPDIGIETSNFLQNAQVKSSKMTQISAYFSLSTPLPYLIGVVTYNNENWSSIGHLHQMAHKMGTG